MTKELLKMDQVTHTYGDKIVIHKASLEIQKGRVIALLGPNGTGKSTLFKLVTGLIEADAGQIRFMNENPRSLSPDSALKVANMIDGYEPPNWATAKDLIQLQTAINPRYDQALAEKLISSRGQELKSKYSTLSKGQKRWLLASTVLATKASLTLLDEPADGLDTAARYELYDHVREIVNNEENTVIIATHIIKDIERISDEVIIMRDSKIILHEEIDELKDRCREVFFYERTLDYPFQTQDRILAAKHSDNGSTYTLLLNNHNDQDLRDQLGDSAEINKVDLEKIYLALTES